MTHRMTVSGDRYLAADIGGTSSRFAIFQNQSGRLHREQVVRIATSEAASFADLLGKLKTSPLGPKLADCRSGVLAVAGAVQEGTQADPPNIPWSIDIRSAPLSGMPKPLILLNDFAAQAYACKTPALENGVEINAGRPDEQGMLGVIGPGTGLGHGMLVPLPEGGFLAFPSEAGHTAFSFANSEETVFAEFVRRELDLRYVHAEAIVSGQGLTLLHQFHFGRRLKPEQVAAAMDNDSPVRAWFARFLGRACRHFALNVLATAGMVVAGGVAAKNPDLVQHPEFLREFTDNPNYQDLLQSIPVTLNVNEDSGLWGAALAAKLAVQRTGSD
ncbi:MAG: ROK family protein [Desulfovibrionales bacterium]|nr:MAG: ROK family protein [Desulfovibrionales bacterium]